MPLPRLYQHRNHRRVENRGQTHFPQLICLATLQTIVNHQFSRSREEGDPASPLNNNGLTKLNIAIFKDSSRGSTPKRGRSGKSRIRHSNKFCASPLTFRRFPESVPLLFGALFRLVRARNACASGRFRVDAHNFTSTVGRLTNLPSCGCLRESTTCEKTQNKHQIHRLHIVPLNYYWSGQSLISRGTIPTSSAYTSHLSASSCITSGC
jgi:hypothetical protein